MRFVKTGSTFFALTKQNDIQRQTRQNQTVTHNPNQQLALAKSVTASGRLPTMGLLLDYGDNETPNQFKKSTSNEGQCDVRPVAQPKICI